VEKHITILIPALNEASRIENTISAVKKSDLISRIIVLDDGSTDNTFQTANELDVEVYRFNENHGKGYALNFGIQKAMDDSSIMVFLDADTGSTAIEVEKLIIPIINNDADVTIARFPAAKKKGGFGLVKNLAKFGVKSLTGKSINTSLSGQRAFKVKVLEQLGTLPNDYGIEVGMIIDIFNKGFIVKEVEVNMTHRETGRDIRGFIHRGKQFYQISKVLVHKFKEVKK